MNDRKIEQRWALLWLVTSSRQFHRKFHFIWKNGDSSRSEIYRAINLFWPSNWVNIARVIARFLMRACRGPQRLQPTQNSAVFVLARPTRPSCAGARPQEHCHWFCSQNRRFSSGIVLGVIASLRWRAGAKTWTQTWTLPPDKRVAKASFAQKSQNNLCGV